MAIIKNSRAESYIPKNGSANENLMNAYRQALALNVKTMPLDIERFIAKQGILLVREDMDSDISGYIEKRGNDWVIGVNKYHAPRRQRFTLAHEFAHYILDRDMIERERKHFDTILFRGKEFDIIEKRANEMAADILMPKDLFEKYLKQGIRKISDLADKFDVSPAAIRYRAYKLGHTKEY